MILCRGGVNQLLLLFLADIKRYCCKLHDATYAPAPSFNPHFASKNQKPFGMVYMAAVIGRSSWGVGRIATSPAIFKYL